jgi:hypothetical protein
MKNATRLTSVVLALAFCASAFAGSDQPQIMKVTKPRKTKVCYVMTTASGIPIPCERIRGIPTTGSPMDVIGNKSPN